MVDDYFDMTKNSDSFVRYQGIHLLSLHGSLDHRLLPTLIELLADPVWTVRSNAVKALAKLGSGDPAVFDVISSHLGDTTTAMGITVRNAIKGMIISGFPIANKQVDQICTFINDSRSEVRFSVISILKEICFSTFHSVDVIIAGLSDISQRVSLESIAAVRVTPDTYDRAVPILASLLNSQSSAVSFAAAWALGALGNKARPAISELLNLLPMNEIHHKFAVIYAIARIDINSIDTPATLFLQSMLTSGNADYARLAKKVLD